MGIKKEFFSGNMLFKSFLMTLPRESCIPEGICPKCKSPLEARKWKGKLYFLCKNFSCDFYTTEKPK